MSNNATISGLTNVLEIQNVVKRYGTFVASNAISFRVGAGKIFGLLGPNGAGKTTLIRMITNILLPDEGRILLFSESVGPAQQNRIGYLPEERGLYKNLKVIDQIRYFAELKGLDSDEATKRARYWLDRMGALDWEKKKIQELSKGMQQKVQFISTILHKPDLLILDEPFSGLDPVNAELLISIIHELRAKGTSIILSTHVMEQVEKLCDDIALVNRGSLVLNGPLREVKSQFGRDTVIIEFVGTPQFLDSFSDLRIVSRTESRVELKLEGGADQARHLLRVANEAVDLVRFERNEPSLHEIFVTVVEQAAKESSK